MRVVVSSGHGLHVRGASGVLDEVNEARRVVEEVAKVLRSMNIEAITFHDDVSKSQGENLERIVDFHNAQGPHDFDVSVHFNAYAETDSPMGVECLYTTQAALADLVSENIANASGLIDRGPKKRTDLYFLNQTIAPAILVETCFVDSTADAAIYDEDFVPICAAIASAISGTTVRTVEPPSTSLLKVKGKVSYFGGPDDMGVDADEGLAFIYEYDTAPYLFLDKQPPNTTGLARRLNVDRPYVACRWDYDLTPKTMLAQPYPALVRAPATAKQFLAWPADWGPHQDTGRVADISPSLMDRLGITTDDEVEVIYPAPFKRTLTISKER